MPPKPKQVKWAYPLRYVGNVFWLIFFLILWLPLGLLLLIKNGRFSKSDTGFYLHYRGKFGWLFFWAILFFPITIILLCLKGVDVIEQKR